MRIPNKEIFVAVISHNRPENMAKLKLVLGQKFTVYVNRGQGKVYKEVCNKIGCKVRETKFNDICTARNLAIEDATKEKAFCIQVSDDLRKIEQVSISKGKRIVKPISFQDVSHNMVDLMKKYRVNYSGVAITTSRLNFTGKILDIDKLIVNDLIGIAPGSFRFDVKAALKEDYEACIRELVVGPGVLRMNSILCHFPHRENKGGANDYRTTVTETLANNYVKSKWAAFVVDHKTRPGQISLNYKGIAQAREEFVKMKSK